ncbi:hypothetical protein UlMin_010024 [Ulmus minor]
MSALSARRPKDRAGAGAKTASTLERPFKPLTPIPMSDKRRSSAGKENPSGPSSKVSAIAQKSAIRPVARVDKAFVNAGNGCDGVVRWSTSSAPRGRSSSPSEFVRLFNRRVSAERPEKGSGGESDRAVSRTGKGSGRFLGSDSDKKKKGFSDLAVNGIRDFRDNKESGKIADNLKKNIVCEDFEKTAGKVKVLANCDGKNIKSSDFVNLNGANADKSSASCNKKEVFSNKDQKSFDFDDAPVKIGGDVDLRSKEGAGKFLKVEEVSKEKGLCEDGVSGQSDIKYPSKLHEKLAFLEGKVKRIASDIKRTKEMLDMNNPDASKVVLLDLQDKISGIEKAMGKVSVDSDAKKSFSSGAGSDDRDKKMVENVPIEQADNGKGSEKVLNCEVLEARLFPHQKLLRNRTTLKASSGSSNSVESRVKESSCESKVDEKELSPVDENPIAVEFLASLNKEPTKVTVRERRDDQECREVQEMDGVTAEGKENSSNITITKDGLELILTSDEKLDEFDDQENRQEGMIMEEETEDLSIYQLNEIGCKTSTGGWFVSEGESVLLTHDDNSCTYFDVVNNEEKAIYKPPAGVSPNMWQDCWIIRAPSADGCSGRYVVAASAGNAMDSGFCSWDYYTKDVRALHIESRTVPSRTVLGPLPNNISNRRNAVYNLLDPETRQWWYKPCGPLIAVTSSYQRAVRIYDIRDGEHIMKWDVPKPVTTMDYSSPLQWRNRGKVVVAEAESISLWDVNSLNPQALLSVSLSGRRIYALHVNNTDAELGGGVRQRLSSSEAEGNDGVFCTQDSINILDFRHPTGVGLKIPKHGVNMQSVFSRGDSVFLGCTNTRSGVKKQSSSEIQQFSLRKQRLFSTYVLPECNADPHHTAITQVWGNSNNVMGVCGLGLFVFDASKDNELQCFTSDLGKGEQVRDIVGPDDLYSPSFDYFGSRALLISRDRPAMWRNL